MRDLTGQTFGSLVVIGRAPNRDWTCRCVCGKTIEMKSGHLTGRYNHSCGCQRGMATITHGATIRKNWTPEYIVWAGLFSRCRNTKSTRFHQYGGRGITLCERWHSYEHFLADMGPRPDGHTIDRIDNNRGYSPDNCRWATQRQQQRNRSNNRMLTWNGRTMCSAAWAEHTGLPARRIASRLHRGWSVERTLSTPVK